MELCSLFHVISHHLLVFRPKAFQINDMFLVLPNNQILVSPPDFMDVVYKLPLSRVTPGIKLVPENFSASC